MKGGEETARRPAQHRARRGPRGQPERGSGRHQPGRRPPLPETRGHSGGGPDGGGSTPAYKDIERVMRLQTEAGLVTPLARMRPIAVIMAGE